MKPSKWRKNMGANYAYLLLKIGTDEVHYWGGLLYNSKGFLIDHHTNTRESLMTMWPKMLENEWVVRTRKNSARYSLNEGVLDEVLRVIEDMNNYQRARNANNVTPNK